MRTALAYAALIAPIAFVAIMLKAVTVGLDQFGPIELAVAVSAGSWFGWNWKVLED